MTVSTDRQKKKVAVQNLGCKVNRYEADAAIMQFADAGYEIVSYDEVADIYILNTCAVTAEAARKSRQQLNRAKRLNPDSLVVAIGCQAELTGEDLPCDLAVGNARKAQLLEVVEDFLNTGVAADHIDIGSVKDFSELGSISIQTETRAYLKVQDGCNNFCTYCTIPFARGRVRSRKEENIIEETRALADAGYQEVVLTGIHVCSYGAERGEDSAALMRLALKLAEIDGIQRIRLSSLEPQSITDTFIQTAAKNPKICPHFHLSLQSGSDTILKRMNRKYDTSDFRSAVKRIRNFFPDAAITTDIIVGFPGETEELFQESYDFCKEIGFSRMHVFRYSERPGTRAVNFDGKVSGSDAKVRSEQLIILAEEMREAFWDKELGKSREVLLEARTEAGNWTGYTLNYIPVEIILEANQENHYKEGEIVSVLLKDKGKERMFAEIEPLL